MKYFMFSLVLSTALMAGQPSFANETIFSQEYKTRIQGISITTTRSLVKRDDGTFRFRIRSSNFFVKFEETSLFEELDDGSFRSLSNESERKIIGISNKNSTLFDWDNMVATFRRDGNTTETPIEPGMLDRTLYQYLMELDMQAGRPVLSYDVVDKGRIRNFTFENLGVEDMEIDDQDLSAFKLRRITEDNQRETLVWMAADLDYQIVKIYHREDEDEEYTMTRKF